MCSIYSPRIWERRLSPGRHLRPRRCLLPNRLLSKPPPDGREAATLGRGVFGLYSPGTETEANAENRAFQTLQGYLPAGSHPGPLPTSGTGLPRACCFAHPRGRFAPVVV